MGFQEKKPQESSSLESDPKKWFIAGIPLREPLKPIYTKKERKWDGGDSDEEGSTTPTGNDSRIPAILTCPPAPKKQKSSLKHRYSSGVREFFKPPDLETVFILHVKRESAN